MLCNIAPKNTRRYAATQKLLKKVMQKEQLPLHWDLVCPPPLRLLSRRPIWSVISRQTPPARDMLRQTWETSDVTNKHLVQDSSHQVLGMDLNIRMWCS